MRNLTLITAALCLVAFSACKKTGEGEYEVEKPVVGTVTDTIHTPSIDVSTDTHQVTVPNVDIRKDTATIKTPDINVKSPSENKKN